VQTRGLEGEYYEYGTGDEKESTENIEVFPGETVGVADVSCVCGWPGEGEEED
jgi:hypothetical protein